MQATDTTTTAAPTEAPAPSAIDRALDALTIGTPPAATPPAPAAPPTEPPKAPEPPKATPDADAVRVAQERAHAAQAAKIERERVEIETARRALETDRKAIADAQRLARLAKDDPARFLAETGQDAVAFAKRVAERERVSDATRTEFDKLAQQNAELAEKLAALEKAQTSAQAESAKATRAQAVAQLRDLATAKHQAAAHYLSSAQMDETYIDALADEVRAERGFVTLDAVAERLDLRMRDALRTMLETPWGREMAAGLTKPTTTPAPTGQDATRAAPTQGPPKTLTRTVTDDRTSAPRDDAKSRAERALDIFLGKT
jgi:hypothetical protein